MGLRARPISFDRNLPLASAYLMNAHEQACGIVEPQTTASVIAPGIPLMLASRECPASICIPDRTSAYR